MSRPHLPLVRWFRPARRIAPDLGAVLFFGVLMLLFASAGRL